MSYIDDVEYIPTLVYAAYNGKKQLALGTFKEARKALWREAVAKGLTDAKSPREFLKTAERGAGAWAIDKLVIKEFIIKDVAA